MPRQAPHDFEIVGQTMHGTDYDEFGAGDTDGIDVDAVDLFDFSAFLSTAGG